MTTNRLPAVLFAFIAVCLATLAGVSLLSEESDALGTFTGGTNTSTEENPYTGIRCNYNDMQSSFAFDEFHVYYVELGSEFTIKGLDPTDEFHNYDRDHMVISAVGGIWAPGADLHGFFYNTGQCFVGIGEDYVIVFEVVCNNTTKVQSVYVSGASTGTYTTGLTNSERSLQIYTNPRYSASPAPTTMVKIEQTSGYGVVDWRLGTSASGLVPYIHFTPKEIGTATFRITATDGSGVYTDFTVQINEVIYGKLDFNANGGTGAPAQMEDDTYTGTFYYWIPEQEPTRSGYTFLGWSENRYATTADYKFDDGNTTLDDRFRTTSTTATLYAIWEQNLSTYYARLVYDAQGGTNTPAEQSASITASSPTGSKSFVVTSDVPIRAGYDFLGWSIVDGATSPMYHAGDSVSVAYGNTYTLFAVWEKAAISVTGSPDTHGIVGTTWRYTPTLSTTGCTLSVSGADWLMVSSDSVTGTPVSPGTYNITITATKTGYNSGTQSFSVTILSNLSFQSSPTGGAIIYAK